MRLAYLLFALYCAQEGSAQKRNEHWIIGSGNNVDFLYPEPVCLNDVQITNDAVSMSDTAGSLLFYGSGSGLFNRLHQPLVGQPSSDSLAPHGSVSPGLAIPYPGHADQYVIFLTGGSLLLGDQFCSLTVDLTLDAGSGAVLPESFIHLEDSLANPKAAVAHANGEDYWLIAHKYKDDRFMAFLVNAEGIDLNPIVSHSGPSFVADELTAYHAYGNMTASLDGSMLIEAATRTIPSTGSDPLPFVDLYHFDTSTGQVQHWLQLPNIEVAVGSEFSPDGSKLYLYEEQFNQGDITHVIWQYDLQAGSPTAIQDSRIAVFESVRPVFFQRQNRMAMGVDGRIYVSWNEPYQGQEDLYLGVIEHPDSLGAACGYEPYGFMLNYPATALPEFCKRYHDSEPVWLGEKEHAPASDLVRVVPNPMTATAWLVGSMGYGSAKVSWYDASGRLVRQDHVRAEEGRVLLDRGALPAGSYVASVEQQGRTALRVHMLVE